VDLVLANLLISNHTTTSKQDIVPYKAFFKNKIKKTIFCVHKVVIDNGQTPSPPHPGFLYLNVGDSNLTQSKYF
jgi:hypothetical protein